MTDEEQPKQPAVGRWMTAQQLAEEKIHRERALIENGRLRTLRLAREAAGDSAKAPLAGGNAFAAPPCSANRDKNGAPVAESEGAGGVRNPTLKAKYPMTIEQRIKSFAKDTEIQIEALAMLKVGHEKGDSAEEIMSRVIASLLMRFHGIPIKKGLN